MFKWLSIFLICAGVACAADLPRKVAVVRGLDKITGRTKTFSVPVGSRVQFGKIYIEPKSCFSHPPEESPEDSAFLYIYEQADTAREMFKGWMFSSNPALSTMEDPVYDVWLLACQDTEKAFEATKTPPPQTQSEEGKPSEQPAEPAAEASTSEEEITD